MYKEIIFISARRENKTRVLIVASMRSYGSFSKGQPNQRGLGELYRILLFGCLCIRCMYKAFLKSLV